MRVRAKLEENDKGLQREQGHGRSLGRAMQERHHTIEEYPESDHASKKEGQQEILFPGNWLDQNLLDLLVSVHGGGNHLGSGVTLISQ